MTGYKCPFSIVQAAGTCHCRYAHQVVRRGGSEFDCKESAAHSLCTALTEHLNARALPALGYVDDLTQTPKSVYERILIGGLKGLRTTENSEDTAMETADIWPVVEAAAANHAGLDDIPDSSFIPAIEACALKRRQRRQRS